MSRPAEKVPAPARPGEEAPAGASRSISGIVGDTILGSADVSRARERRRIARLRRLVAVGALALGWVVIRRISGHGIFPTLHLPHGLGTASPDRPHRRHAGGGHAGPPARGRAVSAHAHPPGRDPGGPGRPGGHRPDQGRGRAFHQPVPRPSDVPRRHGRLRPARRALRGAARNGQDVRGQGHGQGGQRPLPVRVGVGLPVHVLRADQPQNPFLLQAAPQARPQGGRRHRLHRGDRCHRGHSAGDGRHRRERRRVGRGQRAARAAAVLRHAEPGPAHHLGLDRPAQPLPPRRGQAAQAGRPCPPTCWWWAPPTARTTSTRRSSARDASTAASTSGCRVAAPGATSSPTTWARRRTPPISTSRARSTSSPA